jgi:hypothetical protein
MTRMSAELRLDIKSSPKLSEHELHYQISENSRADTTVGWLKMDSECDARFHLVDSTDFTINSTSGQLKTRHPLDREKQHRHELKVEVFDSKTEKQLDAANVIVDVLDV